MRTFVKMTAAMAVGLVALAGCGQAENDDPQSETADMAPGEAASEAEPAEAQGETPELIGMNLKVKPGLWESEAVTDGDVTRSQFCVGENGIPLSEELGSSNPDCQPDVSARPGRVSLAAKCEQQGIKFDTKLEYRTSRTRAEGDLNIVMTMPDGTTTTVTSKMTSRWVADACPADLPPGESRSPDDE